MNLGLIAELYAEARYWHGTGRYKYSENGETVDILAGMIAEGGLVPHDDDWDWKLGKIRSISFARSRMYSKIYAGLFVPDGKRIKNEYIPRWVWFEYFINTARIIAFIEHFSFYGLLTDYDNKLAKWTRKITNKKRKTMRSVFLGGTDITKNYPILIGIKSDAVKPLIGARIFNLHEAKSESSIGFNNMTHIEVPGVRITETTAMLKGAGIQTPVVAIEDGEAYCRTFSFFRLASGQPLCRTKEKPAHT